MAPRLKQARHAGDAYHTPPEVVAGVLPYLPDNLGRVLDPCAGTGVFEDVLGHRSYAWENYDIEPPLYEAVPETVVYRRDFFQGRWPTGHYDTVIGNPPFSLAEQFIRQALLLAPRRLVFLTRLSLLEGQGRYKRLWSSHPPDLVAVLPKRPSFGGYGGDTDKWAYCWLGWGDLPVRGLRWTALEPGQTFAAVDPAWAVPV